jgi:HPt (histidine-containing phosphotransfer) domain-containing protein
MVFNDAHRLKSTLGTLGIEKLKEPIIAIEKLTHSRQNLDEIASIFEDFKQQCQTEIPKLEAELRQL